MKYFIWADGQEQGPYEFDELYDSWKKGELPRGFLWRRESARSFSPPSDLESEKASQTPGDPLPPRQPRKVQRRKFRVKISSGAGIAAVVCVIAGLSLSSAIPIAGVGLVLFGFFIMIFAWCDALLRGAAEIISQLDQIRQLMEQSGDIDASEE